MDEHAGDRSILGVAVVALTAVGATDLLAQDVKIQAQADRLLPQPEVKPLAIDFAGDPVLGLSDATADPDTFRTLVVAALEESPVERLRPRELVDFTFSIAQFLIDFRQAGVVTNFGQGPSSKERAIFSSLPSSMRPKASLRKSNGKLFQWTPKEQLHLTKPVTSSPGLMFRSWTGSSDHDHGRRLRAAWRKQSQRDHPEGRPRRRPHSPETKIYLNRGVSFICTGLADRKFCELPD